MSLEHATLILRNKGYITPETQERIRTLRIVIAGCGMGSFIAEALVRMGAEHLTLVDGDIVEGHNLNRQNFVAEDIGVLKVNALAKRLMAITPNANIRTLSFYLDKDNAKEVLEDADLVIDTIDLIDLQGIAALHAAARKNGLPIISALNIGFGAGCVYFPSDGKVTFEEIFNIKPDEEKPAYIEKFTPLLTKLASVLDPKVTEAMIRSLTVMEDGKPCPAPQLSAGSLTTGAFVATLVVRILSGEKVTPAPALLIADLSSIAMGEGIDLMSPENLAP